MKINAPLTRVSEIKPLVLAGADRFYTGVLLGGELKYCNGRKNIQSNFKSLGELHESAVEAKRYNKLISVCFNLNYKWEHQKRLYSVIEKIISFGINTFVVQDIGFYLDLKEKYPECTYVLSTLAGCFNSEGVKFYQDLGLNKIVLPRQMMLEEIRYLHDKANNCLFEIIIQNVTCNYINAFCRIHTLCNISHPAAKAIGFIKKILNKHVIEAECKSVYGISTLKKNSCDLEKCRGYIGSQYMCCGLCAIPVFYRIGVDSLKVVGRGFNLSKKVKDIALIKKIIRLIELRGAEYDYTEEIRSLYKKMYKRSCRFPEQCHYQD